MKPNDYLTEFLSSKKHKQFFSKNDVANWIGEKINPGSREAMKIKAMFDEYCDDLNTDIEEDIEEIIKNLEYASKLIAIWLRLSLIEITKHHASGLWYKVL